MSKEFAQDVDHGLSQTHKKLSSKYFYNQTGDALFIEIMKMPEYYLTRSEMEIFSQQTSALIEALEIDPSVHFELIELGAGDGSKTKKLLKALSDAHYQYDYMPIDISKNVLDLLENSINNELPEVSVATKHGDYFTMLESLKESQHPKVVLFLGSNIGNMNDKMASEFLYALGSNLKTNDKLLLGVDLIKSADVVMPAYNDKQGITQRFNMNLLHRMNQELDATFDVEAFEHAPEYDEEEGIAKSYITSKCDQQVSVKATGKVYPFKKGEKIHTETSRKYNDELLQQLLRKTDFTVTHKLTDSKNYFADYILHRQ